MAGGGTGTPCGDSFSFSLFAVITLDAAEILGEARASSSAFRLMPRVSSSGRADGVGVTVLVRVSGDLLGAIVNNVSAAS